MRIVFMTGGPRELALQKIINHGYDVVSVICPFPTRNNSRFLKVIQIAERYDIPVVYVEKHTVQESLEKLDYDVLVSCGFSFIINRKAIATAKLVALNVHPTLLPKYRGYRSGPYILMNGEKESGVTIHELTEKMDNGDIFLQRSFPISKFDTTKSVFRKAKELEPGMIVEVLESIENNTLVRTPQNEANASEYNKLRLPKDSILDPNKSLLELYDFIRSCDFEDYPAYFFLEDEKIKIKLERANKPDDEFDQI